MNSLRLCLLMNPPGPLPLFDIRYNGPLVTKLTVDESTVLKQLKNLNIFKPMGPDGCHPRVLKEAAEELCEPLCLLMNKTFEEQCIPALWKEANVSALFKNKGVRTDPSNYRPVSLTCIPCKLCFVCLFVLRFYGPVNPMGSCRARSVYLTTRLLGRLSPLRG